MLTKSQQREVNQTIQYLPVLGVDYAARVISALHRAAMRAAQQQELMSIARTFKLTQSPDWII
jgi:hypothetical protein